MATVLRPPLVSQPQKKRRIAPVDYFSRPLTLAPAAAATLDLPLRSGRLFDSAPRKRWQGDALQSQGLIVYDGPEAGIASLTDSAPRRRKSIGIDQRVNLQTTTLAQQAGLGLPLLAIRLDVSAPRRVRSLLLEQSVRPLVLRLYQLALEQGAYALSGQSVGLLFGHKTPIAQGSYSLTGQDVTLSAPADAKTLPLDSGSYTLTGSDVTADYVMAIVSGSYALSGQALGLKFSHQIGIGQGAYALTGQDLALRATRTLGMGQGSYALSGQSVTLVPTPNKRLTAITGLYTLTGNSITLIPPGGASGGLGRPFYLNSWWGLNYLPG